MVAAAASARRRRDNGRHDRRHRLVQDQRLPARGLRRGPPTFSRPSAARGLHRERRLRLLLHLRGARAAGVAAHLRLHAHHRVGAPLLVLAASSRARASPPGFRRRRLDLMLVLNEARPRRPALPRTCACTRTTARSARCSCTLIGRSARAPGSARASPPPPASSASSSPSPPGARPCRAAPTAPTSPPPPPCCGCPTPLTSSPRAQT